MGSCRHPVTSDLVSVETVPSSDNVFYLKKKIKPGKLQTREVLQHVQGKNIWKALSALKIGLSEVCYKGGVKTCSREWIKLRGFFSLLTEIFH